MHVLRKAVDRLSGLLGILAALSACLLVIAISYDVVNRELRGGSVAGLLELSETLLVAIVFLGLPYAEQRGAHVRMTLAADRMPSRVAHACRTIVYSLSVGVLAWMAYKTAQRALDSFETGEAKQGLLQWPLWPARTILSIGLVVLVLQCVFRVLDGIRGVTTGQTADTHVVGVGNVPQSVTGV